MIGQFNTNIIFRILAADEAKIITKRIGEIEFLTHQKNTSYGAHEFRDGISYTEQEKRKDVIQPSDIANLKEGECYILLPLTEVAICKTTINLIPKPKDLQPAFIYNPDIETLIRERQVKWQGLTKTQKSSQKSRNNKPYEPRIKAKNRAKLKKQKLDNFVKNLTRSN